MEIIHAGGRWLVVTTTVRELVVVVVVDDDGKWGRGRGGVAESAIATEQGREERKKKARKRGEK